MRWHSLGGTPKMIYLLLKFILPGGGVLYTSLKGFLNGIFMLLIYFIRGRRAFYQPEGLFEWDIDTFYIQCKLYNYQLRNIY